MLVACSGNTDDIVDSINDIQQIMDRLVTMSSIDGGTEFDTLFLASSVHRNHLSYEGVAREYERIRAGALKLLIGQEEADAAIAVRTRLLQEGHQGHRTTS